MIPVSLLAAYIYCPRKVFLKKVLKLDEPTRESKVLGTIRHEASASFTRQIPKIIAAINPSKVKEDISQDYEKTMSNELRQAIINNKAAIDRLKLDPQLTFNNIHARMMPEILASASTVWDFIKDNEIYGEDLWQKLTPKIKSEYSVESEKLGIRGIIDQVQVYPDKIIPVEIKTGRVPKEGFWPGHRIQLTAHIMLLEDKFSNHLDRGLVYYADEPEFRELHINQFMRDDVSKTVELIAKLLSGAELPPIIKNQSKCTSCGLKEKCYNPDFIQQKLDITG